MSTFYFPYDGNKRSENKHIEDVIEPILQDVECIIEPFAGSASFSFAIFQKYGNRFKYILNDNDSMLCEMYRFIQKESCKPLFDFANEKGLEVLKSKSQKMFKELIAKKDDLMHWFFYRRVYSHYRGQIYFNNPKFTNKIGKFKYEKWKQRDEFIKTVIISNLDYTEFLEKHRNKKALVYIDPPYFQSYNGYVHQKNNKVLEDGSLIDYTSVWPNIYQYMKNTQPCVLVTNHISILDFIFKEFYKKKYGKRYNLNTPTTQKNKKKKNTEHAVYANF